MPEEHFANLPIPHRLVAEAIEDEIRLTAVAALSYVETLEDVRRSTDQLCQGAQGDLAALLDQHVSYLWRLSTRRRRGPGLRTRRSPGGRDFAVAPRPRARGVGRSNGNRNFPPSLAPAHTGADPQPPAASRSRRGERDGLLELLALWRAAKTGEAAGAGGSPAGRSYVSRIVAPSRAAARSSSA